MGGERDYANYGIEAYLDYLEDSYTDSENISDEVAVRTIKASRTKAKGQRGRGEVESESATGKLADDIGKRSVLNANCSSTWHSGSHRWRYTRYIPSFSVRTKMWVDSLHFKGSASDPNSCDRAPVAPSGYLEIEGTVNADAACGGGCNQPTMVRINRVRKSGVSELHAYKRQSSYGTAVKKPQCGYSTHRVNNGGTTFTFKKRSGYCVG